MNWSTAFLTLVFIFRLNIIEHVTRLGAFSKLRHFILKFNRLNYYGHHYYLSQHFNVLNFADRVCLYVPNIIGYSVDVVLKNRN